MPDYKSLINARVQRAGEQMDLRALQRQAAQNETVEWDTTVDAELSQITVDERIQVRVGGLDQDKVREYAVVMSEGGTFPPVVLFRDGETLYLADGFHRVAAAQQAGKSQIRAEVRPGGFAGAVEYAEDANLTHGFALSTRDKRNIFERRVRRGHEWEVTSDREVARQLGVDQKTIGNWRRSLTEEISSVAPRQRVGADGRVYDVSNIQAANEQRSQEQAQQKQESSRPPAPRRVTQHDGYDFNQDSGYEEDALDYGEPETWRDVRQHQPDLASSDGESAARRVNVALVALLNAVLETAAAIETMDAGQDHFTAGELRDIETSATEVLQYLQGYRSRQGQWVTGLLDLVDGLRRFAAQG